MCEFAQAQFVQDLPRLGVAVVVPFGGLMVAQNAEHASREI